MYKIGDKVKSKFGVMTGVVTCIEPHTGRVVVLTDATESGSRIRYAYKEQELESLLSMRKINIEVEVPTDVVDEEIITAWQKFMKAEWDTFEENEYRNNKQVFVFEYNGVYLINGDVPMKAEMLKVSALVRLRDTDNNVIHIPRQQTLGHYYTCYGFKTIEKIG